MFRVLHQSLHSGAPDGQDETEAAVAVAMFNGQQIFAGSARPLQCKPGPEIFRPRGLVNNQSPVAVLHDIHRVLGRGFRSPALAPKESVSALKGFDGLSDAVCNARVLGALQAKATSHERAVCWRLCKALELRLAGVAVPTAWVFSLDGVHMISAILFRVYEGPPIFGSFHVPRAGS